MKMTDSIIMKKSVLIIAAALAACFISCKKEDPDQIQVSVTGDGTASRIELAESVNAPVVVKAPRKIGAISLSMDLGGFNSIANQHIGITQNKSVGSKNAVFDLVSDTKVVAFLKGLGLDAGEGLIGRESLSLDIKKVILNLLQDQVVENDRTFTVYLEAKDQEGFQVSVPLNFHFTSAPEITWPMNPEFNAINFNRQAGYGKEQEGLFRLQVTAPGKIASLVISLNKGSADTWLVQWVKNRVTNPNPIIDPINDLTASNKFETWFSTGAKLKNADRATLNFFFINELLPDFSAVESTNIFTITVTDSFGKTAQAQAKFFIPAL